MKRLLFVVLASVISCRSVAPSPVPAGPHNHSAESWNRVVNFDELRATYGEREDFFELCEQDRPLKELFSAANSADWIKVVALTGEWLDSCPVDIDAHYLRAIAFSETGNSVESEMHIRWFEGLMDSVVASGDGKTSETPFIVISVPEEYSVMRAFRLEVKGQMLLDDIDTLMAIDNEGNSTTVHFRPDAHWRRLEQERPASE